MKFSELPEYQRGLVGERLVRECWLRDGYYLVDTRDFRTLEERAPRLYGGDDAPVMPDFLVFKDGTARWVEVKSKGRANFFRALHREEHGFNAHLARQYQRAQQVSGLGVWIVIYEEETEALLCGRFDVLMDDCRRYDGGAFHAMVNFARDRFAVVDPAVRGGFDRVFFPPAVTTQLRLRARAQGARW